MIVRQVGDSIPDAIFAPDAGSDALLEARRPTTSYTVRKGDSLSRICRAQYGAQASEMQRMVLAENPQVARRAKRTIFQGETLQLPVLDDGPTARESDADGMEASDSFTLRIEPDPEAAQQPDQPAVTRTKRTTAAKVVKTPPKSDTVRKSGKPAGGKKSAKADPPRRPGRPVAAAPGKSNGAKSVQSAGDTRGVKSAAATRRGAAPGSKADSGKRGSNPDKRDARRSSNGNVVLVRRD
jgi:hypothetical protein